MARILRTCKPWEKVSLGNEFPVVGRYRVYGLFIETSSVKTPGLRPDKIHFGLVIQTFFWHKGLPSVTLKVSIKSSKDSLRFQLHAYEVDCIQKGLNFKHHLIFSDSWKFLSYFRSLNRTYVGWTRKLKEHLISEKKSKSPLISVPSLDVEDCSNMRCIKE